MKDESSNGTKIEKPQDAIDETDLYQIFNPPESPPTDGMAWMPKANVPESNGGLGAYHNYEQVVNEIKKRAKEHPDIISVSTIGKTHEGRPIEMARITSRKTDGTKKPEVLIMGQMHAREYISAEVALGLINTLTDKYGKDDQITKLVNERDFYIVPVVNPDGSMQVAKEMAADGDSSWRKNCRDNNKDGKLDSRDGVDLNRNFGFPFYTHKKLKNRTGASTQPSAGNYRGPHPFSEPETKAIKKLVEEHDFSVSISYHSHSGLILFPPGDTKRPLLKGPVFRKLAEKMRDEQQSDKYTVQRSYDMYPTAGASEEWLRRKGVTPFAFEIYKGGYLLGGTFQQSNPPDDKIQFHVDNNVPAALYLAGVADDPTKVLSTKEWLADYAKDVAKYAVETVREDAPLAKKYAEKKWRVAKREYKELNEDGPKDYLKSHAKLYAIQALNKLKSRIENGPKAG